MSRLKTYRCFGLMVAMVFCASHLGFAQSVWSNLKSKEQMADSYYENGQYQKALELYNYLVKNDKVNPTILLRLGRIEYDLKAYSSAVQWLEQYQLNTPLPEEDMLVYANALVASGNYTQAVEAYNAYIEKYGENDWLTMKVWRLNNLTYLYEDSLIYSITPLGINTRFSEFPTGYYNDGLLFISDRNRTGKFKRHVTEDTGRSTYSLFYSQRLWPSDLYTDDYRDKLEPSSLVKPGAYHVAGITFLPGLNKFIYAKNIETASNDQAQPLQLYEKNVGAHHEGKLLSLMKTKYSVKDPSLTADGKTLYIAADNPEGYGGYDLYKSEWKDEAWSDPENLGPTINTPGNEAFPFVHNSGFLYYSSDGLPGFGGYDLFKINLKDQDAEPQNLGYPLNGQYDDFALILNERGDRGHFASNRKNGGLDDDIYVVEIDLQHYPLTITGLLKFKNLDTEPVVLPEMPFEVVDNNTQKVVYKSKSDNNGRFSIDIPYASQFFIRIQIGDADPLVVSLEIPKNKDKQANHEIVVVSNRYIPIQQTNNR